MGRRSSSYYAEFKDSYDITNRVIKVFSFSKFKGPIGHYCLGFRSEK